MSPSPHPEADPHSTNDATAREGSSSEEAQAGRGPAVGPGDVDPVDHLVDVVRIDGEEGAVPGEWL